MFVSKEDFINPIDYEHKYVALDMSVKDRLVLLEEDGLFCVAKTIKNTTDDSYRYFVKFYRRLYNPFHETDKKRITEFKYLKVSEKVFNAYLTFLKTGNDNFLSQAERQI